MHLSTSDLIGTLRSVVDGPVVTAGDSAYEAARTPYFSHRIGQPVAVLRPRHAHDVAAAVRVASGSRTPLHIRSGGHSAHSTGDGVLIDLGGLTELDVDRQAQTVWAGSGLTVGALNRRLGRHDFAVGLGDTGSTGIGGVSLGGGIGFLARQHGLTIDNLLGAEMVTADGCTRLINCQNERDLFWAIRGGGGNFGVVTRFHFRLASLAQVYGGDLVLPATARTIMEVASACREADRRLTAIVNVTVANQAPVLMIKLCHTEPDQAETAVRTLRDIASPLVDRLGPIPYWTLAEDETPDRGLRPGLQTMYIERIDEPTADAMIEHLHRASSWLRLIQFRVLGGAVADVAADATAYAHRQAKILLTIIHGDDPDHLRADQWARHVQADLDQGVGGAYVNFLGPGDGGSAERAYPDSTLTRLRRIKAAVDPDNVFCHNVNIPPAGETT